MFEFGFTGGIKNIIRLRKFQNDDGAFIIEKVRQTLDMKSNNNFLSSGNKMCYILTNYVDKEATGVKKFSFTMLYNNFVKLKINDRNKGTSKLFLIGIDDKNDKKEFYVFGLDISNMAITINGNVIDYEQFKAEDAKNFGKDEEIILKYNQVEISKLMSNSSSYYFKISVNDIENNKKYYSREREDVVSYICNAF